MKRKIPNMIAKVNVIAARDDAEPAAAEQPQVDQGIGERLLSTHEEEADAEAEEDREQRSLLESARGDLLQPVDQCQHGDDGEAGADEIQATGVRVAILRQQPRAEREQQKHHGHSDEKDGAPPEELEQQPAQQRAQRGTDGEARRPHADRERPLLGVEKHVPDERERRRGERRRGHSEQRARHDQHLDARREGREHRADPEGGGADEEQAATADTVAERAHRDQEAGQQEAVDVRDPEQLRARGLEIGGQRGHRQIEDGQVHRVEQARQGDHSEPDPLAPPGPGQFCSDHELDPSVV